MAVAARHLTSIQGEQQGKYGVQETLWADPSTVDEYVDSVPENYLPCRLGRGHDMPPMRRKAGISEMFTEVDSDGNPIRRTVCKCCGKAERVEIWSFASGRLKLVTSYIHYPARLIQAGEVPYTNKPGHGRMRKSDMKESLASGAVKGMTKKQFDRQLKLAFG